MTQPSIEVEQLTCRYGDFLAVDSLSFTVHPGEIYALLGTNGAGKTTALEALEGHRPITAGNVRLLTSLRPRDAETRRRSGIMLRDAAYAGDLTVLESLHLFGQLTGRREDQQQLLSRVGLAHRANVRTYRLSGGERRLLDFALASFGRPELLFLDEPTTGLDPARRAALWDLILELRDEGSTILLTTHYLEEAEQHADRIGLLHAGKLCLQGSLGELTSMRPSTITFEWSRPDIPAPLPLTSEGGGHVTIQTRTLQTDLLTFLTWAANHQVDLRRLHVAESSLSEIFNELAGSNPEDLL